MSDPLNNPRSSGTPCFAQEQYGLFRAEPDRKTQRPSPLLGLMSNLDSRSGTNVQSLVTFRQLKPSGAAGDVDMRNFVDFSRTTEEVRHIPVDCGTLFTSAPRDTSLYPMCSTSRGQRNPTVEDPSRFLLAWSPSGSLSTSENISRGKEHETESVTNVRVRDKTETESSCTKYTPELATKILRRYGLEKDDLEQLLFYPEDQITAENLPLVLQQIRIEKEKKTSKSEVCPGAQSNMSTAGTTFEGTWMYQDNISSNIKPSEETNTGLCGTFPAEVVEETGRTCLSIKDANSSSHCKELQLKGSSDVKLSSLASLYNQDCPTSLSSVRNSVTPPTSGPPDQPPAQTSQNLQKSFDLFHLPKQDIDMRRFQFPFMKDPKLKPHSAPENQPSDAAVNGVHPDPRAFELDQNETQQEELEVVEPEKNQDQEEQQYQMLHQLEQEEPPMEKVSLPKIFSTLKPASLPSRRPRVVPPVPVQPLPSMMISAQMLQKPFSSSAEGLTFKGLPPAAMMDDYSAATPETFPHTCSLCNHLCTNIKDWIYHQNYRLHLENCKFLRKKYPSWDGEIPSLQSFSESDANQLPSPSAQTFVHRDQKPRPKSRSRSGSNSLFYNRCRMDESRSRSRSLSPYYHQTSMSRRRKRRSQSGDSQNSRSRSRSPWYDSPSASRYPSPSRSPERRSTPKRSEEKPSSRRRRPADDRSSHRRKKWSKTERLTKRLLKISALRSLLEPPKLKVVVKTLVPVVLAELRKMKSSAASSSSSSRMMRRLKMKLAKAKSVLQRMESASSTNPQADECFDDDDDDAEKLKRMKSLNVEEVSVSVVTEKDVVVKKQKKTPQQELTKSALLLTPRTIDTKAVPPNKTLSALIKAKKTKTRKRFLKAKILVSKAKTLQTIAAGKRAAALSGSKKSERGTGRVSSGTSKQKPSKNTKIKGNGCLKAPKRFVEKFEPRGGAGASQKGSVRDVWSQTHRVESLRSLKQRLQESREILKNLELDVRTERTTVEENPAAPVPSVSVKSEPADVEIQASGPDETVRSRSGEEGRPETLQSCCPPGAAEMFHIDDGASELDQKLNIQTSSLQMDVKYGTIKEGKKEEKPSDCRNESQTPGPESDQVFHQRGLHVPDWTDDDDGEVQSSESSSVAAAAGKNLPSGRMEDGTSEDVRQPHRNKDRIKSKDFSEPEVLKTLSSAAGEDQNLEPPGEQIFTALRTRNKTNFIKDKPTRRTSKSEDEGKSPKRQNDVASNTVNLHEVKQETDPETGSAEQQLQSESPDGPKLEGHNGTEAVEQRRDPIGPEPKRLCCRSSVNLNPVMRADPRRRVSEKPASGQEFVVPKWGFFCSLCSVFYLNKARRDAHCCSREHYDNLQKHFEKHKRKLSEDQTKKYQSAGSD